MPSRLNKITQPFIYEINAWPWLEAISRNEDKTIDLGSVPGHYWDDIADLGFDGVWLMGVWRRSPAGIAIALTNDNLRASFEAAIPDWQPYDVVGSPYCVRDYVVDDHFGGRDGLAGAREALDGRGLGLILDFVPNHVAPDHPWTTVKPEVFVSGTAADLDQDPTSFVEIDGRVLANGRDPYFPAWPDVVQLNAFAPELRAAVIETLNDIAEQCDGVRCDMAMLVMNDVFARTWGDRVGPAPSTDYWPTVIAEVRAAHPGFLFLAEAYWDLEGALQQQGFNYCYDKRLYDRILHSARLDQGSLP
jgi:glycosidase